MALYALPHELQYEILKYLDESNYEDEHACTLLRILSKHPYIKTTDDKGNTFRNGQPHSYNDQPAVIEGLVKYYCFNGVIHRIGGPAMISLPSLFIYYINGVEVKP